MQQHDSAHCVLAYAPRLYTKLLVLEKFLAQRRNDAKHCRVSSGVLCAFASLREKDFFH